MVVSKIISFVKRDFRIASSYKLGFILGILTSLMPILLFFFVGMLVGDDNEALSKYGGSYFAFAVIGLIMTTFFTTILDTFAKSIRDAQTAGCIEALLSMRTKETTVVLLSAVYTFILAGVQLILSVLVLGFLSFDFSGINVASLLVIFTLSLFIYLSVGIITASFTIMIKKGNPIGFLFGGFSAFIAGAYFPTTVFPDWMQTASKFFPTTYILESLRMAILQGHSIQMLATEVIILASLTLLLFPISLFLFERSVIKGKRNGSLIQY